MEERKMRSGSLFKTDEYRKDEMKVKKQSSISHAKKKTNEVAVCHCKFNSLSASDPKFYDVKLREMRFCRDHGVWKNENCEE